MKNDAPVEALRSRIAGEGSSSTDASDPAAAAAAMMMAPQVKGSTEAMAAALRSVLYACMCMCNMDVNVYVYVRVCVYVGSLF